jgi:hypothetical protein
MHLLAIAYLLGLAAVLAVGVRSPFLRSSRAVIAILLLLWAVLILTAQVLSFFSAINITGAYVSLSFVIAGALSWGLRAIALDKEVKFSKFAFPLSRSIATYIGWFLAISAGLVFAADLLLAYGLLPANADSISYRFPRAYWYFGSGSLMHFTNAADKRALYYPFNGTLTLLPLIHFRLGPRWFTGDSLISWLAVALTTYVFSRDLGGPRIASAASSWLICLTPNVLIQSLSTNDEIIAAAPLLAGLFFVHRWFYGRQLFDAVLGVVGVSISAGTKLHIMFYWPLLLAVAAGLAFRHKVVVQEAKKWLNARGAAVLTASVALIIVFSFSFVFYNIASSGRATAWEFDDQLLNRPFNLHAALQNITLYTAQIVLTPLADLHSNFNYVTSAQYYEGFNRLFKPLFTWVDNGPAYTSVFYRFTGINSSSAIFFNELTVFIGFTWLVALIAGVWLFSRRKDPSLTWARFHVVSLPVWIVTFAAMTRYIEGFTVYLGYAAIVVSPIFVYAFAPIDRLRLDQVRWLILAFVAVTHCYFAATVLFTSLPRNLRVLHRAASLPASPGFAIDPSVEEEIGRARAGVFDHSIAWEQPHWIYMAYHPEILQFMARIPNPIPVPADAPTDPASIALHFSRYVAMPYPGEPYLHVYSFPQIPVYGNAVPVRIPDKASPGLTLIGKVLFALGPEWIFAAGNNVDQRHPNADKYVVLYFLVENNFGHEPEPVVRFTSTIYGLGPKDDLKFRFELRVDGVLKSSTTWQSTPEAQVKTTELKGKNSLLIVYVRNDNAGGAVYSTQFDPLSKKPHVLTEGGP